MIKVKELIEMLNKCNPEAVVCVSEKSGRGGQIGNLPIVTEFTLGEYGYAGKNDNKDMPAVEISCNY